MGDFVLFYHSNFTPPHVAGIARVSREGYPAHTAQDPNSKYFDSKATPENPRWMMVDIEAITALKNIVPLEEVKNNPACENMLLVRKGQRLSVQPVEESDFDIILAMGGISRNEIE